MDRESCIGGKTQEETPNTNTRIPTGKRPLKRVRAAGCGRQVAPWHLLAWPPALPSAAGSGGRASTHSVPGWMRLEPADRGEARPQHRRTACFDLKPLLQGPRDHGSQGGHWHSPRLRLLTSQPLASPGEGAEDETRVGPGGKQGRPKMRGKAYFVADAFIPLARGPRLAPRPPPSLPSSFQPETKAEVWVSPEETVLGALGVPSPREEERPALSLAGRRL